MAEVRRFQSDDLEGVIELCAAEGWPSFPEDPARALRALTAPGVTTVVADAAGQLVGFAQLLSDGEIQAHLSLIAVHPAARRQGLARQMLRLALAEAGGIRIDLLTDTAPEFYAALPHRRLDGFRIWPQIDKLPE
jgi:ribosomal protein S18 acetylase RimI-like enzyme